MPPSGKRDRKLVAAAFRPPGRRLNCWQYMGCGLEPGGALVGELGVCPAGVAFDLDGVNRGLNGGRICWAVVGTFCEHDSHCPGCDSELACLECDFFRLVQEEEGTLDFVITVDRGPDDRL